MEADRYSFIPSRPVFCGKASEFAGDTQHLHHRAVRNRDVVNPAELADQRMLLNALADQRLVSNSVATLRAELNLLSDPIRAQLELPPELERILAALEAAFRRNPSTT